MDPRDDLLKLDNQLCFALVTAARNVVSIYRPVLEPLGLTHPQYLVMLALWERAPRSLANLAGELAMEPATLSPLVKRLEAQGLVSRARNADDERQLDITITSAGRALRERALGVPDYMSIVGFDDMEFANLLMPAITTVRQSAAELGRTSVGLLVSMLTGNGTSGRAVHRLPVRLIERASVAPPRAGS